MRVSVVAAAAMLGAISFWGPSAAQDLQSSVQEGPTSVVVLGSRPAEGILGKEVRNKANENMGRIVDIIVDSSGRPRTAIIDFGGFFGVGNRKIAVDWSTLNFESDGRNREMVVIDLTREQVKAAPVYNDKRPPIVLSFTAPRVPAD